VLQKDEAIDSVGGWDGEREEVVVFGKRKIGAVEAYLFDQVPAGSSFLSGYKNSTVEVEEGDEI